MPNTSGYTIIEVITSVVIFGIMTALVARGYPAWRSHQQLVQGEQIVQNAFRDAQQQALQEIRDEDCVHTAPSYDVLRLCSDIGLWMEAGKGEIIYFADTNNPDENEYDSGDFYIRSETVPSSITFKENRSFVFQSLGPAQKLYSGQPGLEVTGNSPGSIILSQEPGANILNYTVGPYGQIQKP